MKTETPYTTYLKNKIIQTIELKEIKDDKFPPEFNHGITYAKEEILKVIRNGII